MRSSKKIKMALGLILVNVLTITLIIVIKNKLPPVVPLFYGRPEGEEQLAPKLALTIPPLISMIITTVNLLVSKYLKDTFLQAVLMGIAFTATALSIITVLKIISLVGNF